MRKVVVELGVRDIGVWLQLLDRVRDESVTYASNKHPQPHPKDYEDPSPLLTPEPQDDYLPPPPPISPEPNSQQNTSNDSQVNILHACSRFLH